MADKQELTPNEIQGDVIIYQTEDGKTKIDVRFVDETVWLSQQQMAELFQTARTNIVHHIGNIYDEGELDEKSTCQYFRQVRQEGNRTVSRELPFYNLDMIISLGYRVKSIIATHFRRLATERLKEYQDFCFEYKVTRQPQYSYSQKAVDFIFEQIAKDPENILTKVSNN